MILGGNGPIITEEMVEEVLEVPTATPIAELVEEVAESAEVLSWFGFEWYWWGVVVLLALFFVHLIRRFLR